MAPSAPFRIIVRTPNWIGDQILAFPFFHYLRKAYPNAHITAVCVPWVEDVQFRGLIDEIVVLEPPTSRASFIDKLKLLDAGAADLKKRGPWDLAISLPNSLSAAWLLWRSGSPVRRGYAIDGRGILLTERLRWNPDPNRHRAQAYVNLLTGNSRPKRDVKEFWGIPAENELDPDIPGELKNFDPEREWSHVQPIEPPEGPYWVLAPGATADSRRWSEDRFAALAREIVRNKGLPGVIVGGPKEAPIASRLCEDRSLQLRDGTARGPVSSLWKVFRHAKFTVTNESGLAHVASLCGSPVQIVCGAADPRRTRPLGPGKVQVMINPVDCWPCERNTCSQPGSTYLQCLKGIQPDAVWEEIKRGLRP